MADRGRDLKLSLLSDLSRFDVDKAARQLDNLAGSAEELGDKVVDAFDTRDATRGLDRLGDSVRDVGRRVDDAFDTGTARREVDDLADRSAQSFGRVERTARDLGRKVDNAFDTIARSSRTNLRGKLDDDLDKASEALDEFKDEAGSSGREAAASFSGGFDDITDFIQETAANAFGGFGPLGAAAGIAAAAGIGVITKVFGDSKEKAEEAKAAVGDWVQAFIDGQGKIQAATIEGKLQELLGDPDKYREIIDLTDKAHISAALYARALSGDADAAAKVKEQIIEQQKAMAANTDTTAGSTSALVDQQVNLQKVAEKLGIATGQIDQGRDAWQLLDEATRAGITADVDVNAPTQRELANEHAQMQRELGRPVRTPVKVDGMTAARIEWGRLDAYFRRNPITIRTKGPTGQRPIRDVP